MARLFVFVCAIPACDKTRAPVDPTPQGTPRASASAVPSASGESATAPSRDLGDGCHAGVPRQGSAAERARAVAEACAPGGTPLGGSRTFSGPGELQLELGSGAVCVRVIAVAEQSDADLSLELLDQHGKSRGVDTLPGSVALVGAKGPVCFMSDKTVVAKVGFARGGGSVLVSAHRM